MTTHEIPGPPFRLWSTEHEPVLTVSDGDVVEFTVQDASGGVYDDAQTGANPPALDFDRVYPLAGPVVVEGAESGDVVSLEPLEFTTGDWAWTASIPGLGLLPDDFDEAYLYRWDIQNQSSVAFHDVATIPLRPFLGVMAVTPDVAEPTPVMPPGHFGGNMDCRDLVVGSTLYLPVQLPGARLAFGDPHGAQGDGEVCVSAMELGSMQGAVRVRLHKDRVIPGPQFETTGPLRAGIEDAGHHATMGVAPDLMKAAQDAVRAMIDLLGREYRLEPRDAYLLCSVVVDLKISEVVDAPNWVVTAYLPKSVMNRR